MSIKIKKILKSVISVLILILSSFCGLAFADEIIVQEKYNGATMESCRGIEGVRTTKKVVALTFDDGPHKKYTKEILEILKLNNIRATFFVIGKNAENNPGVLEEAYTNGNVIANHTYSHFFLTKLSDNGVENEMLMADKIIYGIIGVHPALFRPPYGACSVRSTAIVGRLGFATISWDDMTDDYNVSQTTPEKIANSIIKYAHPGAIIGFHDGGGNREKTVKALPVVIEALRSKGYKFLTIPELLNIKAYADQKLVTTEKA